MLVLGIIGIVLGVVVIYKSAPENTLSEAQRFPFCPTRINQTQTVAFGNTAAGDEKEIWIGFDDHEVASRTFKIQMELLSPTGLVDYYTLTGPGTPSGTGEGG